MAIAEVLATFPNIVHAVVLDGSFQEGNGELVRNDMVIAQIRITNLRNGHTKPAKAVTVGNSCTFSVVGHRVIDGDYIVFQEQDLMNGVANISDTIVLPG